MTNYKMRFDTSSVELAWEYDFDIASDSMAFAYASRHAEKLKHDLVLFKQEIDDAWEYLGRIQVQVHVTSRIYGNVQA